VAARQPWTPAEDALLTLLVTDQHLDSAEIAARFAERNIRRTQKAIQRRRERLGIHAQVQPSDTRRWNRPLHVEADRALIMADPHVPFHDADWCNRVIDVALAMECDTVAIPGDLVDFTAFAKWGRQERVEAEDEIRAARSFLRALARSFSRVVYTGGNHEMRLPRITGNLLELRDVMDMFIRDANVLTSDYHWFELMSGGEKYHVEHPRNASVIPARIPTRLASKYLCHIIGAHGHQWGQCRDVSGTFWCIDSGVCADPVKLAYISKVHSTRPKVYQGAVLVLDGVPVLLSPDNIALYESRLAA